VQIDEVVDEVVVQWLLERRIELGFVVLPDERFDTLPLVTDELVAVLPASHPLASKKTVSAKDFHNRPFIRTSAGSGPHIDQFLGAQGAIPKTLFRFEQLTSMMGFVVQGDAIAIAARLALPDAPAGLVYRSLQPRWPREIALAALSFDRLSPAARAFIEIATKHRKHLRAWSIVFWLVKTSLKAVIGFRKSNADFASVPMTAKGRKPSAAGQFESPTPPKNNAFWPEQVIYTIPFGPPCKLSSKFQFFNPHRQAVDLIGLLSISSWPAIEKSARTQGHDADWDAVLLSTSWLSEFEKLNKNNDLRRFRNSIVAVLCRKSQELFR
jgi:LysR substrate binding domain